MWDLWHTPTVRQTSNTPPWLTSDAIVLVVWHSCNSYWLQSSVFLKESLSVACRLFVSISGVWLLKLSVWWSIAHCWNRWYFESIILLHTFVWERLYIAFTVAVYIQQGLHLKKCCLLVLSFFSNRSRRMILLSVPSNFSKPEMCAQLIFKQPLPPVKFILLSIISFVPKITVLVSLGIALVALQNGTSSNIKLTFFMIVATWFVLFCQWTIL